ncbi:hypothetical protein V8F06_000079 [Rhypophila decipiens]
MTPYEHHGILHLRRYNILFSPLPWHEAFYFFFFRVDGGTTGKALNGERGVISLGRLDALIANRMSINPPFAIWLFLTCLVNYHQCLVLPRICGVLFLSKSFVRSNPLAIRCCRPRVLCMRVLIWPVLGSNTILRRGRVCVCVSVVDDGADNIGFFSLDTFTFSYSKVEDVLKTEAFITVPIYYQMKRTVHPAVHVFLISVLFLPYSEMVRLSH